MTANTMRKAFEKWLNKGNHCGCNENMWKAWQAAQMECKHSDSVPVVEEPDCYDAGLLNDFGGGNVGWWQDYIRAELDRAHDFYASQWPTTSIPAQELDALRKDAERYRWLREQSWDSGELCIVSQPKHAVKLGHDCPSLFRLDAAIDAALAQEGK